MHGGASNATVSKEDRKATQNEEEEYEENFDAGLFLNQEWVVMHAGDGMCGQCAA